MCDPEQKLATIKRQLASNERLLQRMLDNIPQQIYWKDRNSVFQGCNLAAARALGLADPNEIIGKTDLDLNHDDHLRADYLQKLDEKVMTSGRPEYHNNVCVTTRNHELSWLDASKVPLTDDHGEVDGIMICIEDISERKKLETSLRTLNRNLENRVRQETEAKLKQERLLIQQGRHAAMGELIGNIGHQWRQPLSTLGLILQNLAWEARESKSLPTARIEGEVAEAMLIINGMSATIDDFRNFFNPVNREEIFSLRETIDRTLNLMEAGIRHHQIACLVHLPSIEMLLKGNANEFSQALLNLLANAKDVLRERRIADGWIELRALVMGPRLTLLVRDNGGGVATDNLERIFDPYFTTKAGGTGIGLYMSRAIIENRLGGTISCRNKEEGAEFQITLPLAIPDPAPTQPTPSKGERP